MHFLPISPQINQYLSAARPLFSGSPNRKKPLKAVTQGWELLPKGALDSFHQSFAHPKVKYDFADDNLGPANPEFLKVQALALSTPHDTYQSVGPLYDRMRATFKKAFTDNPNDPFLVFLAPTGTAANRLGLSPVLRSIDMIIASDISHLYSREAGGYHVLNHASTHPLKTNEGKITPEQLKDLVKHFKKVRQEYYAGYSKPRVVSITQPTEYGTYYTEDDVKTIAKICHDNNMLLQMDGSRLFYLPKKLNRSLKELTTDLGVDIVFLGGSKNGMAMSEAIVYTPNFFNNVVNLGISTDPEKLFNTLRAHSKQTGNLVGQFAAAAAQFTFALEDDYLVNQSHNAIEKAKKIETVLTQVPNSRLVCPVDTNLVLISLPEHITKLIEEQYELKVFPEPDKTLPGNRIVRFMTNYSTTHQQVKDLEAFIKEKHLVVSNKA